MLQENKQGIKDEEGGREMKEEKNVWKRGF